MNAALQIAVDLEQGEIRLGSERVRLLPVAGDVFCLHDARGPLVRALKFEERTRLLAGAGDRDVASLVADAALVSAGVAADEIRVAASLALAGGGEEAPAFPDCAQFVEQRFGWDEKRVGETMALVIDRLCGPVVQQDANGWKQIVFQKSDADLGTLISQMASNLSHRAVAQNTSPESDSVSVENKAEFQVQSPTTPEHGFFPEHSTSAQPASIKFVSSVLPAKRVAARLLALNTDQKTNQAETAPQTVRKLPLATTVPTITQATDFPPISNVPEQRTGFPAIPKVQTNEVDFSLSQIASVPAKIEPSSVPSPVVNFPSWPPFGTSIPKTQLSPSAIDTTAGSFATPTTKTPSPHDWLAELAQLLEAECDMRGIDP